MTQPALGSLLDRPLFSAEAVLQFASSPAVKPQAVVATLDDGLIVAGALGLAGWAAKTDLRGKLIWSYMAASPPQPFATFPGEFSCAATMPDGSLYFGGVAPHSQPSSGYDTALLVHLDANGQLLDQVTVAPNPRSERGVARFRDCVRWGENLAMVGDVLDVVRPAQGGQQPVSEELFWFLLLDAAGNVIQEKHLPISSVLEGYAGDMGPLLFTEESGFVVSATDGRNTDVVGIAPDGTERARKLLAGSLRLVRPVVPDGVIQLFGLLGQVPQLITLNARLEEVHRTQGDHPENFLVRVAYRRPDRSLALFGSQTHSVGARFTSHVVLVDGELQAEQAVDPPLGRPPFIDGGSIWAAAPIDRSNEFVVARSVARRTSAGPENQAGSDSSDLPPDFRRGVALDFIRFS